MPKPGTQVISIAVVAFIVVFVGCAYLAWTQYRPAVEIRRFDAGEWQRALSLDTSNDPGCFRGDMAMDLINNKRLEGLAQPQISALLGQPDESKLGRWIYSVGQCSFDWKYNFLEVTFDAKSKVNSAAFK